MNDQILFYLAIGIILMLAFNKIVIEQFEVPSLPSATQTFQNAVLDASNTVTATINNLTAECNINKPCPVGKQCHNGKCI